MSPGDGKAELPDAAGKKPYVAPRVIFSELYAKGVGAKDPGNLTVDYHSPLSSESTS
jgi:hypothetical protein